MQTHFKSIMESPLVPCTRYQPNNWDENDIGDAGCEFITKGNWKKLRSLSLGTVAWMKDITKLRTEDAIYYQEVTGVAWMCFICVSIL